MKKFKHDNILKILGFASDENYLLLVLPNKEFGNLCAALKEQVCGWMNFDEVVHRISCALQ